MRIPPPHKRLCLRHSTPISPYAWRAGYRNSGCWRCREKSNRRPEARKRREEKWEAEFIPCRKHPDKRVSRSRYIMCGDKICNHCNARNASGEIKRRYPHIKEKLGLKWEKEFIGCSKHPDRRCNKAEYMHTRLRKCASCRTKLVDGSSKSSHIRHQQRVAYRRSVNRRKHFSGKLRGLKLFERSTGLNLSAMGMAK